MSWYHGSVTVNYHYYFVAVYLLEIMQIAKACKLPFFSYGYRNGANFNHVWVIPCQLSKLGAPYVMDVFLIEYVGRYPWEMKTCEFKILTLFCFRVAAIWSLRGASAKNASWHELASLGGHIS